MPRSGRLGPSPPIMKCGQPDLPVPTAPLSRHSNRISNPLGTKWPRAPAHSTGCGQLSAPQPLVAGESPNAGRRPAVRQTGTCHSLRRGCPDPVDQGSSEAVNERHVRKRRRPHRCKQKKEAAPYARPVFRRSSCGSPIIIYRKTSQYITMNTVWQRLGTFMHVYFHYILLTTSQSEPIYISGYPHPSP